MAELKSVGLDTSAIYRFPEQLSGGQRQRAAIARALLASRNVSTKVILADEPTASVDSIESVRVFRRLIELTKARQIPLVVVTHNPQLALLADHIVWCEHGQVEFIEHQQLQAVQRDTVRTLQPANSHHRNTNHDA